MSLYISLPLLVVLLQPVLCAYNCSTVYQRTPDNSDLSVDCGTSVITVDVNQCTAQWAGFNVTDLALNGNHTNTDCQGSVVAGTDPPIIRFQLPVNSSQGNPCRQTLQIVDENVPQGTLTSFSSVQSMIITGFIDAPKSAQGFISYATDIYYQFTCRYPLEYLLNNTQIVASSSSVAAQENNGTFINYLKMAVYNDSDFAYPLVVPSTGLELRKKVYVEVKTVNFTGNFNVLLDHCFGTPSPYNMTSTEKHDFLTTCSNDPKTAVMTNGASKFARFNFEAFRFVSHRDQTKSSIYVHCILRLCEPSTCQQQLACGSRRRRSEASLGGQSRDSAVVSLGPLYTGPEDTPVAAAATGDSESGRSNGVNLAGLAVGVVFGSAAAVALTVGGCFALKKFI
ncbi:zona pellucida-like domain-containing protein 1 isoform X2 [Betta splendens]|nr:zona pellucida-like domain-containing protein 1 isoform X2 [Betta splendens]